MTSNESEVHSPTEAGDLGGRLSALGWGLVLVWIGVAVLAGVDTWVSLIGLGAISLVMQAVRKSRGLAVEGFWIFIGFLFVLAGVWALAGTDLPLLPILLIVAGIALVLSIFRGR